MSAIADIAQAAVDDLNGATLSMSFTATRAYRPLFELADLTAVQVTVIPKGIEINAGSRGQNLHDYTVDIGIQKRVNQSDETDIDALMTLSEEVADHFRLIGLTVAGLAKVPVVTVSNDPVYVPETIDEHSVFTSVITLVFRALR